jgi:hypothetical protein
MNLGSFDGWPMLKIKEFKELSVATPTACALGPRTQGRPYGPMAVGLAFVFVGIQFLLITAWTGWSGLAELGSPPSLTTFCSAR